MPIYRLEPVLALLGDTSWGNSPVREACWVNAADEAEARGMASARFQDARATVPGEESASSPWRDARLVAVAENAEAPSGMTIPYGTVVAGSQS